MSIVVCRSPIEIIEDQLLQGIELCNARLISCEKAVRFSIHMDQNNKFKAGIARIERCIDAQDNSAAWCKEAERVIWSIWGLLR